MQRTARSERRQRAETTEARACADGRGWPGAHGAVRIALVSVWMVLASQLPERTLDFSIAGLATDPQHLVRVTFCHRPVCHLRPTSTLSLGGLGCVNLNLGAKKAVLMVLVATVDGKARWWVQWECLHKHLFGVEQPQIKQECGHFRVPDVGWCSKLACACGNAGWVQHSGWLGYGQQQPGSTSNRRYILGCRWKA